MTTLTQATQPEQPVEVVRTMTLSPASAPPEPQPSALSVLALVERVVSNPKINPDKLEKFIELQERILRFQARAEFDAAFSIMQGELPVVVERGEIKVNGVLRSRYATYEDIVEAVRPVLKQYGFALRHRNVESPDGKQTIVGILSHRSGHSEEDSFTSPPDASGGKNNIQAIGSTRAYGQRYTTTALLGIATRGQDNDGRGAEGKQEQEAPDGYDRWRDDLAAVADNGLAALQDAWRQSKKAFCEHMSKAEPGTWNALKTKAAKVKAVAP